MVLFLLFLMPAATISILFWDRQHGKQFEFPGLNFFLGLLLFLPTVLLFTILRGLFSVNYTAFGFYFYYFFIEHFIFLCAGCLWFFLLRNVLIKNAHEFPLRQAVAFFGGFFSAVCLFAYLDHIPHFDAYILFLLPLLELVTMLITSLCAGLFLSEYGLIRFLALAGIVVLPFIINIPTVLAWRNLLIPSIIVTVLLTGGTGFLFIKLKDR